jgi:hypothetical protein
LLPTDRVAVNGVLGSIRKGVVQRANSLSRLQIT